MKKENGLLENVGKLDALILKLFPKLFWKDVLEVEKYSFAYSNLEEITIPKCVEIINSGAFYHNESLQKVTISDGVKYIGSNVFGECPSLREVNLPDSVEFLGVEAFRKCKRLKLVKLPKNLERIFYDYC